MSILGRIFHTLRVWTGLVFASDSHIRPSHGWLLAEPVLARQQRIDFDTNRAARRRDRSDRA